MLGLVCISGVAVNLNVDVAIGAGTTPLAFDVWQSEHGLEQNPITSIVQTGDGYLWLGTYTALLRFDGARVVVFDSSNTPVLPSARPRPSSN